MNTLLVLWRTCRSAGYYYSRILFSALDSGRIFLGAVMLLIIAPLFVALAGGSLLPFGLIMAVESIGILWGILRFKRPPENLPPLNLINTERPVQTKHQPKKAA